MGDKKKIVLSKGQWVAVTIAVIAFLLVGAYIVRYIHGSRRYVFDLSALASGDMTVESGSIVLDDGERYNITRFSLRKGSYTMEIAYEAEADADVFISLDNDVNTDAALPVTMPGDVGMATVRFYLEWPTDRAYMGLAAPQEGRLVIRSISLDSDSLIYTDGIYQLIILLMAFVAFLCIIVRFPGYSIEKRTVLLGLTGMVVIVNIPMYLDIGIDGVTVWKMFRPLDAMTRFGIDTRAQLLRLEGVLYGLLDGQFPVIIAPNFLNENGELSFMYPDLFLYPFALMRLSGSSMLQVFRLMNVFVNIATVASVYYACRQISDKYRLNLVITAFYVFEPHRLRVILEKGAATGMGLPYIFAPLCVAGVWLILHKRKKGILLLALGMTGIIESHVTSTILIVILMLAVMISFIRQLINDHAAMGKWVLGAMGITILMNLGFIVIFVHYYLAGINTSSLLWDEWATYTLSASELVTNVESLYYAAGLIVVVVMLFLTKRGDAADRRLALTMIIYTAAFFWMSSKLFPWNWLIERSAVARAFGNYMQKPHRFYTIMATALMMSILLLAKDMKETGRSIKACVVVSCVVIVFCTGVKYADYFGAGYLLYDEVIGDMNTRQNYNYLPLGVDKDMEFSGTASLSDWDNVESISYVKRGTHVDYHYIASKEDIYAEFPLLLYDGYKALDENGSEIELSQGNQGRVRVYLNGDGKEHEIHLEFKVNLLFKTLYILSWVVGACILVRYIRM